MKQLSKPAKIAVVAAGASIIALTGGAGVLAATDGTTSSTNPESSLIDKLAAKFGLNKSEVQAVFDQERTERQAEHQKRLEERLAQAVADGTLTEDQKSKILAKHQEMQSFMESLKDKTMDERRTAIEGKRDELRQWATDNNIPQEFARFASGMGGRHGGPGGHGGMMRDGQQGSGNGMTNRLPQSSPSSATSES